MSTKNLLLSSIVMDLEEMTDEERAFFRDPCERNYQALIRAGACIDAGKVQR